MANDGFLHDSGPSKITSLKKYINKWLHINKMLKWNLCIKMCAKFMLNTCISNIYEYINT